MWKTILSKKYQKSRPKVGHITKTMLSQIEDITGILRVHIMLLLCTYFFLIKMLTNAIQVFTGAILMQNVTI